MTEPPLEPYVRQWAILLKTQKRDGTWVATPVNVAVDGGRAYFGTPANTAKVKRLRNYPTVEISPCTVLGTPTGPSLQARTRLLDGAEAAAAAWRLRRKYRVVYGLLVPLELRIRRTHGRYYELTDFRATAESDCTGKTSGH
jgi:PPOX class probable F420-dependent enzyme